ncbi:hypothetical protein HAX54_005826 [Datura stramonium]|uniref:DUF7751 domain-containing protein n=1 Tax=Datura stramonium TaxID=4076 RepID=A0ABS8TBS3_DATST|nr:hypothetical protein [Datura stramonium]
MSHYLHNLKISFPTNIHEFNAQGSIAKDIDSVKESSKPERASVFAKRAAQMAALHLNKKPAGVEADITGGSTISSHAPSKLGGIYCMRPKTTLLRRGQNDSLGGRCEEDHGFFCAADFLRLDSSSSDDIDKLAIDELFEVASKEISNDFICRTLKSMVGNPEAYAAFKIKLEHLPENVVIKLMQTDNPKRRESMIILVGCMISKETPKDDEAAHPSFPQQSYHTATSALISDWKQQLERDIETLKSQSNIVLNRLGIDCRDLETLCIKDQALTTESVEKIIGWALSHHFMQKPESSVKEAKLVISSASISYGLNIFQGVHNETKSLKKSLKWFGEGKYVKQSSH